MADPATGAQGATPAPTYRFWTDKASIGLLVLALLINGALLAAIYQLSPQLPERIPILFNPQGQVDSIANKVHLYRIPLGLLLVTMINVAAAAVLPRGNAYTARMLMLTPSWLGALLFAGLWFIIR